MFQMDVWTCKLLIRSYTLQRSGLAAVAVLMLPILVHPSVTVLSALVLVCASDAIHGHISSSCSRKVHSSRLFIFISLLELAKETRQY